MAIKQAISTLTRGADITKPQLSVNYVVAAVIGVAVLMFAYRAGGYVFERTGRFVQGHVPGASTSDFRQALGIN